MSAINDAIDECRDRFLKLDAAEELVVVREALAGALDHLEYLDRHDLVIGQSGCAVRDLRITKCKAAIDILEDM
jgi:hypothetical protein